MSKTADKFDESGKAKGVGTWHDRVLRLQKNQDILFEALLSKTNMDETELRRYMDNKGGFSEEV